MSPLGCNKSHRELRIHFVKEHFYCFCKKHLSAVIEKKGEKSWTTKARYDSHPCEVPWCGKRPVHEVFPRQKFFVSFWQPIKKRKSL